MAYVCITEISNKGPKTVPWTVARCDHCGNFV